MKRSILLLPVMIAVPMCASAQIVLVDENFDSYANGNLLALTAGLPWSTWTNTPGGAVDTPISNEQAASGTLSARFTSTTPATGGPSDIVLRLGNRTTGRYNVRWKMYIPTGHGGHFNIQHQQIIGAGSWMVEAVFRASGTIDLTNNAQLVGPTSFPHDTWFTVDLDVNLGTTRGLFSINGNGVANWATNTNTAGAAAPNQLGGMNFFAYGGGDPVRFYIDDVLVTDLSNVSVPENELPQVGTYPNPTDGDLTIDLGRLSPAALVSVVDITGRQVLAPRTMEQVGAISRARVDLRGMTSGVYFVRIQDGPIELVRRIAKQ